MSLIACKNLWSSKFLKPNRSLVSNFSLKCYKSFFHRALDMLLRHYEICCIKQTLSMRIKDQDLKVFRSKRRVSTWWKWIWKIGWFSSWKTFVTQKSNYLIELFDWNNHIKTPDTIFLKKNAMFVLNEIKGNNSKFDKKLFYLKNYIVFLMK